MASFEEIAAGLDQVANKADQVNGALAQAEQFAKEAADLLEGVMHGAGHLENDFNQAVRAWSDVAAGASELSRVVSAGCLGVEQYRNALQGNVPAQSPAVPGPPGSTSQALSTPVPPQESQWIEQQRSQLPSYITSGIYRDEDGNADLVQSGQEPDGEHLAIGAHLQPLGFPTGGKDAWRLPSTSRSRWRGDNEMQGLPTPNW